MKHNFVPKEFSYVPAINNDLLIFECVVDFVCVSCSCVYSCWKTNELQCAMCFYYSFLFAGICLDVLLVLKIFFDIYYTL